MAVFLNTAKLNEWIPKLIERTEKELVIIVPYIKASQRMYGYLKAANDKGIETTLIYRENKLSVGEKTKFEGLDNLNLLHHPNIHCKCYYNENYLIICSMNLYEYSEKNNREMGILLHRKTVDSVLNWGGDSEGIFNDAIQEIREIINGSHLERPGRETKREGFELDIIKGEKEKQEEECKIINKTFVHKRFEVEKSHTGWQCICKNYFDKIDLIITNRAEFKVRMDDDKIKKAYFQFCRDQNEFTIHGFKLYWNDENQPLLLYINNSSPKWQNGNASMEKYDKFKIGADQLIVFLRNLI